MRFKRIAMGLIVAMFGFGCTLKKNGTTWKNEREPAGETVSVATTRQLLGRLDSVMEKRQLLLTSVTNDFLPEAVRRQGMDVAESVCSAAQFVRRSEEFNKTLLLRVDALEKEVAIYERWLFRDANLVRTNRNGNGAVLMNGK